MPRSHLIIATFILCVVSIFVTATPSFAADRVALVIGNGLGQKAPRFRIRSAATDIGQAFERLNFKVTQISNSVAAEKRKAIVEFERSAESSEIAIVYYAGVRQEVERIGSFQLTPNYAAIPTSRAKRLA